MIYKRKNTYGAVQPLLGHTKLEGTARYLGIEVDDSLEMSEQTEARRSCSREAAIGTVASLPEAVINAVRQRCNGLTVPLLIKAPLYIFYLIAVLD